MAALPLPTAPQRPLPSATRVRRRNLFLFVGALLAALVGYLVAVHHDYFAILIGAFLLVFLYAVQRFIDRQADERGGG